MELSIDTSTRYASVGLSRQGETVAELAWRSERNHSVELVPAIRRIIEHAGIDIEDLTAVFLAVGPGGFSALRVGMSTAVSLATARDIPLVAVGTLEIEALPHRGLGLEMMALIGAGRTRLYLGAYPADGPISTGEIALTEHDAFLDALAPEAIYCGEAVQTMSSSIRERLGDAARIADVAPPTRHASAVALLGFERLQAGDVADAATLEPVYLRSSQASSAARRWGQSRR